MRQFFICCNLHSRIAGKIAKIRTCKNFKQHSMCFTFILIQKLKPSYLAAPSVLSVSFLDFSARESLMSFNSWLSLSTSSSPMPPSPDSPLALSKDCSDKKEALYLSVIVFNSHFYLMVLLFYKVICATRQSSCLQYQGKGRTLILFLS